MTSIAKAFPFFAQIVLMAVALGFAGGFLAGLIAPLVGGAAGFWWSLAVAFGAGWFVYPHYTQGRHGPDFTGSFALVFGTCGVMLPFLLQTNAIKSVWAQALREFLNRSWLVSPPQSARIAGIALPIVLYGAWEICVVWPEYQKHPHYAARLVRGRLGETANV
jgi:hypothetical protein